MSKISVDALGPVPKSLIDFADLPKNTFDSVFLGHNLKQVLDDVILAIFIDESDNGKEIVRNGILVPVNAETKAWRLGRVVLAGPSVRYAKPGDVICFPNNMGVPISNIDVDGYGKINKGIFINEQRIFGICSTREDNESSPRIVKKSSRK
jgi:cellobiose-specific phosphotransferase system component IIB